MTFLWHRTAIKILILNIFLFFFLTNDKKIDSASANENPVPTTTLFEDLAELPNQFANLAYIDFANLKKELLFQHLVQMLKEIYDKTEDKKAKEIKSDTKDSNKKISLFTQKCQLDLFNKISYLVSTYQETEKDKVEGVIILRGDFNEPEFLSCLYKSDSSIEKNIKKSQMGGATFYQNEDTAIAFPNGGGKLVLGTPSVVTDMLTKKNASKNSSLRVSLKEKLYQGLSTKIPIFIIGKPTKDGKMHRYLHDSFGIDVPLESFIFSLDFRQGIYARIQTETKTNMDAARFTEAAKTKLQEARKNMITLLLGLGVYLRNITIQNHGTQNIFEYRMTPCEFEVLTEQISSLADQDTTP